MCNGWAVPVPFQAVCRGSIGSIRSWPNWWGACAESARRSAKPCSSGACAAITVGSATIQVRAALAAGTIPAPAAAAAECAIGLLRDLRSGAAAAATRSTDLSRLLAGAPHSDDLVRVAGAFQRIGTLIEQHRRFFQQPGTSFQDDVAC